LFADLGILGLRAEPLGSAARRAVPFVLGLAAQIPGSSFHESPRWILRLRAALGSGARRASWFVAGPSAQIPGSSFHESPLVVGAGRDDRLDRSASPLGRHRVASAGGAPGACCTTRYATGPWSRYDRSNPRPPHVTPPPRAEAKTPRAASPSEPPANQRPAMKPAGSSCPSRSRASAEPLAMLE
jgi:hypothetical protein